MKDRLNNVLTILSWITYPCFLYTLAMVVMWIFGQRLGSDLHLILGLDFEFPVAVMIGIGFYYSITWPVLQYIVWGKISFSPWSNP